MNITSYVTMSLIFLFLFTPTLQSSQPDQELIQKAAAIHDRVFTIDTHVDTPMWLNEPSFNLCKNNKTDDSKKMTNKVDLPRMKQGGLDAIFFAVFEGQGKRNPEAYLKVKNRSIDLFKKIHQAVKTCPDQAEIALTAADGYRIEKKGKRALYIGIENGYILGKDISLLKTYYELGARYVTLCHTSNNDICDSSNDKKGPEHNGLTPFGKEVVLEMNRLGMVVDVSHISDKSFYDVLATSKAPVMASHSCARAICDNPRNLTDDMLKLLAKKGGVIQVCILGAYVKAPPPDPKRDAAMAAFEKKYPVYYDLSPEEKTKARNEWRAIHKKYPHPLCTVSDAVDHIDHIVKVVGIDYVGIGTDFDGGGGLKDCFDVSQMGNITLELVKRGYTEEQIRKIWGGNFMRVFQDVEKTAKQLTLDTTKKK